MVVKNDVIFGKPPDPPVISHHNLKTPSPKPMTSFVNDPLHKLEKIGCQNLFFILVNGVAMATMMGVAMMRVAIVRFLFV